MNSFRTFEEGLVVTMGIVAASLTGCITIEAPSDDTQRSGMPLGGGAVAQGGNAAQGATAGVGGAPAAGGIGGAAGSTGGAPATGGTAGTTGGSPATGGTGGAPPPPPEQCNCFKSLIDWPCCMSDDQLHVQAKDICATRGFELSTIAFENECGCDMHRTATFACCAPPAPTPSCTSFVKFPNCITEAEATADSTLACESAGRILSSVQILEPCVGGGVKSYRYECCDR